MPFMRDPNTPESAVGGPPGSQGAASINAAAEAIKAGTPPPELAEAIRRGYEPHDINLRGIYIFGIALVITLILALVIVAGIMKALDAYAKATDPLSSPVAIDRAPDRIPLQPTQYVHETVDREDMDLMRKQVERVLSSAGQIGDRRWIPITQAIDQVLPMLPIHATAPAKPSNASPNPQPNAGASASFESE